MLRGPFQSELRNKLTENGHHSEERCTVKSIKCDMRMLWDLQSTSLYFPPQHTLTVLVHYAVTYYKYLNKQECIPVGCVPSAAVAVRGVSSRGVSARGVSARGVSAQWDVCLGGECLPRGCLTMGVCLPSGCVCLGVSAQGGCLPQWMLGYNTPPLWTEFLRHTYENITFPQLRLRTVNICTISIQSMGHG